MSPSLQALAALDAERDEREADLRRRLQAAEARNHQLDILLGTATALCSRHTLALGLLIAYLQAQGLDRAAIDRLTLGSLDLG